jgi:putative membrane protein
MVGEIRNTVNKVTDALGGTAGKMSASTVTDAETFVEKAAIGDRYEIEAAKIALDRSRNEDVRLVARRMIADHMTSTHNLNAALEMRETDGVASPPGELDTRHRTMLDHLASTPDESFDSTYMDQQVLAHEETVSLMHHYGYNGDNPQLRSVAMSTLPVVTRHLAHVKQVNDTL